jgi:hypothetical protein
MDVTEKFSSFFKISVFLIFFQSAKFNDWSNQPPSLNSSELKTLKTYHHFFIFWIFYWGYLLFYFYGQIL